MINSPTHQCPLCDSHGIRLTNPRIERQNSFKPQKSDANSTTVVDLNTPELNKTLTLAIDKFPCLKHKLSSLEEKKFLPEAKLLNISRDRKRYFPNRDNLVRLCYLTTFKEGTDKAPVTKEEAHIFAESQSANEKTHKWLGWRAMTTYFILAGCAAGASFIGLITLLNKDSDDANNGTAACNMTGNSTNDNNDEYIQSTNQTFNAAIAFATAGVFGVATNYAGLWWTGRIPDQSSIKANEQQNRVNLLHSEYLNLSYELISLYFDKGCHPLAKALADEIDIRRIANILNDATNDAYASELVGLDNLESVINFIKSEGSLFPRNKDLQRCIEFYERVKL